MGKIVIGLAAVIGAATPIAGAQAAVVSFTSSPLNAADFCRLV